MNWLRKLLARIALSRSEAALVRASGGAPRTVRGMTLDARFQFIEAQARRRPVDWAQMTPAMLRGFTEQGALMFGGEAVSGVRTERIYIAGRSHSVPALLYLPIVRDNTAPLMVYMHFGGGVVGSLRNCHRLCSMIARDAGAPVLSVDYRLAPEHKFPVGLEDCLAAYAWAHDNAARYGAPARRAAIGGDSMGGNFAAIIAQEMRQARPPSLQLLIYPGLDLNSDTPSMHDFADAFPLTADTVKYFIAQYLPPGADLKQPRLAPGLAEKLNGLAPALVYTAGFDMLLDQGAHYAERLRAAGVPARYHCFESLPHGFVSYPAAAPVAEAAIRRIARETAAALKGRL